MKKKIVAMCATVAIAAVAVGGTLAYFTDTDSAKNTMTAGNVDIVQGEWQNNEANDGYVEFDNTAKLYPATGDANKDGLIDAYGKTQYYPNGSAEADDNGGVVYGATKTNDYAFKAENNAVDKIVTVANVGTEDAFVRTLFAFQLGEDGNNPAADGVDKLNYVMMGTSFFKWIDGAIEVDGVEYAVGEFYYGYNKDESGAKTSYLPAGTVSYPSLLQVYLSSKATNDDVANFLPEGEYNILVLSQAVQAEGFETAEAALDAAFGDVTAATAQGWFDAIA